MVRSSPPVTEPRARLEDLELAGDRLGGRRVVAGDHDGADMRALGDRDGRLRLGARRVDHADDAEQHEVVLDALRQLDVGRGASGPRIEAEGGGRHRARGDRERAQRLRRPARRCARDSSARRSSPSGTALPSSRR